VESVFERKFHWHCKLNASRYGTLLGLRLQAYTPSSAECEMRRVDVSKLNIANLKISVTALYDDGNYLSVAAAELSILIVLLADIH